MTIDSESVAIPRQNDDLAGGLVSLEESQRTAEVLTFKKWEARLFLSFKVIAFLFAATTSFCFLYHGLTASISAVEHIKAIQCADRAIQNTSLDLCKTAEFDKQEDVKPAASSTDTPDKQVTDPSPSNSQPKTKDITQSDTNKAISAKSHDTQNTAITMQEVPDKKAEKTSDSSNNERNTIAMGSIITLIAFILGVGLTLALTVLRFASSTDTKAEPSTSVAVSGPLTQLVVDLGAEILNKLKPK